MKEFFDIDLVRTSFVVNKESYGLFLQLYIEDLIGCDKHLIVLRSKSNDNHFLIAASKNKNICPVSIQDVDLIKDSLKKLTFPNETQIFFSNFVDSVSSFKEDIETVALNEFVFVLTKTNSEEISDSQNVIEIEFCKKTKLVPEKFCFGAFDGLNMQINFELTFEQLSLIKNWGILSPIKVFVEHKLCGEFSVQEVIPSLDNKLSIICETKIASILKRRKTGWMKTEKINPIELTDFLVSESGMYNTVSFPEGYLTNRWYIIAMPVDGVKIVTDLGIGNVHFCNIKNDEISKICEFIPDFNNYESFAFVYVNSDKLHNAFMQAKKQIEQSVDLLVNLLKDDSIYDMHAISNSVCKRNITSLEQKVKLAEWIYIEMPLLGAKFGYKITSKDIVGTPLISRDFENIKDELTKIELLLLKANGTIDKDITPLLNSLKWIRRAWDADDFDDKVIYAIIALEFIVSKESNVPMLDKPLRKKCKGAIRKILTATDNIETNSILFQQNVCDKFDRSYTETPFMLKLRNLINRLNIPVTEEEFELIETARKRRNGIVHGDSVVNIPDDDIYMLCECISKIAFYKLLTLEA